MQQQIRNNTTDVQSMVEDLKQWSGTMHSKEKVKVKPEVKNANLPPIRNKIDIKESLVKPVAPKRKDDELLNKIKRDNTPMPDYYKAWDKISKQVEEDADSDNEVGAIKFKEETNVNMMQLTSGAPPNTKIVVKGGLRKQLPLAEEFKN